MDASVRAEKIGEAAQRAFMNTPMVSGTAWSVVGLAAVRAAYEIDGVRELVEAAEIAISAMGIYPSVAPRSNAAARLHEAASRVREAMGGVA